MIIKSKGNLPAVALDAAQAQAEDNSAPDDCTYDTVTLDSTTASMLLSIFDNRGHADFNAFNTPDQKSGGQVGGDLEGGSSTASVKFMITMQEEKELRDLGYSQAQIDVLKPQEAGDILKAGRKSSTTE